MTYSFETFSKGIQSRQVDDLTSPWRALVQKDPPRRGWLRLMRESLGMTTRQLAQRLKVTQPRVVKLEKSEVDGALTLKSLRDAADALNCDFVYAVVPRKSIRQVLEDRAVYKANRALKPVLHTMALESQSPSEVGKEELLKQQIRELLAGPPKRLWDEKP